jgi:hypothetical protein
VISKNPPYISVSHVHFDDHVELKNRRCQKKANNREEINDIKSIYLLLGNVRNCFDHVTYLIKPLKKVFI